MTIDPIFPEKRCFVHCGERCNCSAGQPLEATTTYSWQEYIPCSNCGGTGNLVVSSLADRLRYLRAQKDVSVRQIPGISSASISQIETGAVKNPSVDKLVILADFFGVTVDWLVGRRTTP